MDIGCGSADLIQLLDQDQHYVGIELDGNLVHRLRAKLPTHEFYQRDVEIDELTNQKRKFDTITMIALIEHLRRPKNVLNQCYALLKDEGKLVVTTPTPFGARFHRIGAKLGLTSKEAVDEHHKIYSPEDIETLLSSSRFTICEYRKFIFGMNQLLVCKRV